MMLDVQGLTVARAGRRLIDGVCFAAAGGRLMAVLGPNGAGKTTLLAAIAGLTAATKGRVQLGATVLTGQSPRRLAEIRTMMGQHFDCAFGYLVRDVVALGRIVHAGTARAANDAAAISAALAAADLAHMTGRVVTTLSGGERQRVAFAKAHAQLYERLCGGESPMLLLDEPTASLDPEHQHNILVEARRIAGRGAVVIVTLHDLALASLYADDVLVLEAGRIAGHGPTAEVLTETLVRRIFRIRIGTTRTAEGRTILHPLDQSIEEEA
jgi:iron complex transport system ATP-binding protein